MNFPRALAQLIGEYTALWQIEPWITDHVFDIVDIESIINTHLCSNPMAMDVIDITNLNWYMLCTNPADWALDLIEANPNMIDWYCLARNTNQRAIALLKANLDKFDHDCWEMLSSNFRAIELLRAHPKLVDHAYVMWNPNARELIKDLKIPIFIGSLTVNPADWAVDILLSPNTAIENTYSLGCNTNPRMVAYLLANPHLVVWKTISRNYEAIHHLRANPDNIHISIYANSAIFHPVVPTGLVALLLGMRA